MRILLFFVGLFLFASCSKPVADFAFTSQQSELVAPVQVEFENKSSNAENFEWHFGDSTTSDEVSPVHSYGESGNYLVQLKAKKGTKVTVAEKRIKVNQPLDCLVEIQTDYGNMIVKLSNATPEHRDNFIKLVEKGFYDDLLFHRVINGFMVQGGDPSSKNATGKQPLGMGGPGYKIPAEFVDSLVHIKGALCAARQGDAANPEKESSGSQFYIVHGQKITDAGLTSIENRGGFHYTPDQREAYKKYGGSPQLDRGYTIFGRVIEGLEVIDKIAAVETGERDRPKKDVKMKMRIIH